MSSTRTSDHWRRPRRRSAVTGAGIAAVLVLAVASCGDDDDDASDTTAAASPTTQASPTTEAPDATTGTPAGSTSEPDGGGGGEPTGEPIKLMVIYEAERGVPTPEAPEGAIAAAEEINGNGGIAGRPVEVIKCDTKNDPNGARECGQRAVAEGVVAIVAGFSQQNAEYVPILEQNEIPMVGILPNGATDYVSPASYPITGGPSAFTATAAAMAEAGAQHISVARVDLEGADLAPFIEPGLQRYGLSVENDIKIPLGAPDMTTYAAAAMEGETDGVVVGLISQDTINFILAAKQINPDVKIGLITTEVDKVVKAVHDAIGDDANDSMYRSFAMVPGLSLPAVEQYRQAMADAGFTEVGGDFRLNGYVAVKVVEQVANDLPEVTSAALWDALPQVEGLRTGIIPPLQFMQGGVAGIPRVFNACTVDQIATDGELVPITEQFRDGMTGEPCPAP